MNAFLISVGALTCFLAGLSGWLGWQLLCQNGRMLLRFDEVEKRLDELEFGEPSEPKSLSGNEAADQVNARPHPSPLPQGEGENQDRATRFGSRSLARSRIKRDGLKAGTTAPGFRLPRLDGGELSLEEFRGKRVLLVFSDPHCGPCNALAPELEKFHRENSRDKRSPSRPSLGATARQAPRPSPHPTPVPSPPAPLPSDGRGWRGEGEPPPGVVVVMISRGEPKENRAKVKEHTLTFPVVLQQRWEISRLYAMFATPMAYLIDEAGIITHDVAVGADKIIDLMHNATELVTAGQATSE